MHKKKALLVALCVLIAVVAIVATAASAFAAPAWPAALYYSSSSPGDNAWWFGELTHTSPVPFGNNARWFNQDVALSNFYLMPTTHPSDSTIVPLATGTYTPVGGADQSFASTTTPVHLTRDGVYVFNLAGVNASSTAFVATASVGIDRTRPASWSDAVPIYDGTATVTISATDTLSGAEWIMYSLDGQSEYGTSTIPGNQFSTHAVAGVGSHSLSWQSVDNAGNFEGRHTVAFAVNPLGFQPTVGTVKTVVKKRKVFFAGNVSPLATSATVKLVVTRKSGAKWKSYGNYFLMVMKYHSGFGISKTFAKAGTYRVRAYEGTSASHKTTQFVVK